jgi:hypothetical protein
VESAAAVVSSRQRSSPSKFGFPLRPAGTYRSVDGVSADTILGLPVRLHGIQLGRPVDLVLEPVTLRAVGLHVSCADGIDRFVPLPAARVTAAEVVVRSALMLMDESNLAFYRSRGRTFRALRGAEVTRGRRTLGQLVDLVIAGDGTPLELVVERGGNRERIPFVADVRVLDGGRASAA